MAQVEGPEFKPQYWKKKEKEKKKEKLVAFLYTNNEQTEKNTRKHFHLQLPQK
jgi:hypothetical protein